MLSPEDQSVISLLNIYYRQLDLVIDENFIIDSMEKQTQYYFFLLRIINAFPQDAGPISYTAKQKDLTIKCYDIFNSYYEKLRQLPSNGTYDKIANGFYFFVNKLFTRLINELWKGLGKDGDSFQVTIPPLPNKDVERVELKRSIRTYYQNIVNDLLQEASEYDHRFLNYVKCY